MILSDVDPKFNSKVTLMSELKQFHPNIKVSKVLERKNNSFFGVEEFRTYSSSGTAKVSDIRPKLAGLKPNALSVGRAIIIKDAQIKRKKQPKCANCKGPHVASYKRCPAYKKQAFSQHLVDSQKSYVSILRQNSVPPQPQDKAFTFSAEQLIKFVANVAIQVAQPQVCYANPNQDAIDKKSSLCRRVSEAAKNHLLVLISLESACLML